MSNLIRFPLERRRPDIKKGKGRVNPLRALAEALERGRLLVHPDDLSELWDILRKKK